MDHRQMKRSTTSSPLMTLIWVYQKSEEHRVFWKLQRFYPCFKGNKNCQQTRAYWKTKRKIFFQFSLLVMFQQHQQSPALSSLIHSSDAITDLSEAVIGVFDLWMSADAYCGFYPVRKHSCQASVRRHYLQSSNNADI